MIEIKNLTKYYGETVGCKDIKFNVKQGDRVGFIGPNGSGKTTLIRLLTGLLVPTDGSAKVVGKSLSDKDFHKVFKDFSYLSNIPIKMNQFYVKNVISYFRKLKNSSVEYVDYLIKYFEVETEKKIHELSYGNTKKISIVVALMNQPRLLILDEPTSGLDPIMQNRLFSELKRLCDKGMTVFFSSHILSEIEDFCKRIILIREGSIVLDTSLCKLKQRTHKIVNVKNHDSIINLNGLSLVEEQLGKDIYHFNGEMKELLECFLKRQIIDFTIEDVSLSNMVEMYYESEAI